MNAVPPTADHPSDVRRISMKTPFPNPDLTAYEAITEAQKIAFAPLIFQAVRSMRELGILEAIETSGEDGIDAATLAAELSLSRYGVETLLESGLSSGVLLDIGGDRVRLSKIGYFLLRDPMTRINMDYNHHVCYQGSFYLEEAIRSGKPAGLKVFGEQWQTLYQALPHLPEAARESWYAFDHFYSDSAYPAALKILLAHGPRRVADIGANVGKFSLMLAEADPEVVVTMLDLPDQLANATRRVNAAGLAGRIHSQPVDLLDPDAELPPDQDVYWLSQVLSCFGHDEIVDLLRRLGRVMRPDARIFVLETCWDRQQHAAAAFSLINTSLYFTTMASGNSKMYHSRELLSAMKAAGLAVEAIHDHLGLCHSLFVCRPDEPR